MNKLMLRVLLLTGALLVPLSGQAAEYAFDDGDTPQAGPVTSKPNGGDTYLTFENYFAPSGSEDGISDELSGNSVTFNSGSAEHVFGAIDITGTGAGTSVISGNTVTINGGTVQPSSGRIPLSAGVFYSLDPARNATLSNNHVIVNSGTVIGGEIHGVYAAGFGSLAVESNSLTLNGGEVTTNGGSVYGAYVWQTGGGDGTAVTAENNHVIINAGDVTAAGVFGGQAIVDLDKAASGSPTVVASHNSVSIVSEGTVQVTNVIGGITNAPVGTASANDNSVHVGGNTQATLVAGGVSVNRGSGAADASTNKVFIDGNAVITDVQAGRSSSTSGTVTAGSNEITLGGEATVTNLYGGYNATTSSAVGVDSGNILTKISEASAISTKAAGLGAVNFTYSGDANIAALEVGSGPGDAVTINTNEHEVTFGGEISGTDGITKTGDGKLILSNASNDYGDTAIAAGTLSLADMAAAGSGAIEAQADATLELAADGTLANEVTGEGNLAIAAQTTIDSTANAGHTGMTTIMDNATLTMASGGQALASTSLTMGAGATFDDTADVQSGGQAWESVTVTGQGATYDGTLNADGATVTFSSDKAVTDTMLTVTEDANLDGAVINVNVPGGADIANGDTFSILETQGALTGTPVMSGGGSSGTVRQGSTVAYDIIASTKANALSATLANGRAIPQAKALAEGFLGGLALTTQGADLAAGQGMRSAVRAANAGSGFGAFGTVSGGSMRYDTGSHVDMNSVSMIAGLSFGADTRAGRLTTGAFFEYGNGSYDTNNSFSNSSAVDGDGDTYYTGGGILGRMDFSDSGPGHVYVEGSGRIGKTHNEYGTSDLRDTSTGRNADYDASSLYYGLHLGTGYVWNLTEKASLDTYGKYFWTRQEGDSVSLSTGEDLKFKDADSHRVRLGSRFNYNVNEYITPYVGAAWEYEFDGKARATTNGFGIDAPDMKGSTGVGEIGLTFKPSAAVPLSFDLGVQGYAGQREGVTGSLQMKFEF